MAKRRSLEFRPPADEAECRALAEVIRQSYASFGRPPEFMDWFIEHVGRENLRLVKRGQAILGGLGVFYFRQWFGGRSIASAGITAVATRPDERGTGVGTQMMRALVRELRTAGHPLSVLYPSTAPFYRKPGYEVAGERALCELDVNRIRVQGSPCTIRPMTAADQKAVRALHRAYGRRHHGTIDRTDRCWSRLLELGKGEVLTYVIEDPRADRAIEGYVAYVLKRQDGDRYDIIVRDHAFLSAAAGRRLLAFLAGHGMIVRSALYEGSYQDPLSVLSTLNNHKVCSRLPWMLRLLDVAVALRERGYPRGVQAELHLEIADDVLPSNAGRLVLKVNDGKGRVRTGGRGSVKLDVRGLAPLFSSHLSATELALVGMADARDSDLAAANAVFAGPRPWINDHF